MIINGKRSKAAGLLIVTLIFTLLAFFSEPIRVFANSSAPIRADDGSGIVFKEHEHIQIQGEVLSIQINDNYTANIDATYKMKNTSPNSINAETMFLSPVEFGENKDIIVQKNNENLSFSQEFFGVHGYENIQSIDNWEEVLGAIKSKSKPLGDGSGFFEYKIQSLNTGNELYARFTPQSLYYFNSQSYQLDGIGTIELKNYKYNENSLDDIIIVSRQEGFETNGKIIKTEIDDIYDYLFERAVRDAYEEQLRFAEQQFNLYLYYLDTNLYMQDFFTLRYVEKYVGAITYFVDFSPNEELELSVSYIYQMGTSGYRHTASLNYYLTPAKYWKDFSNIEINLTLSEKFKKLKSSTIDFEKIDKNHFKFTSKTLPETELSITVSDGVFFTQGLLFGIFYVVVIVGIILLIVAILSGIVLIAIKILKAKKPKNTTLRDD